MVLLIPLLMLLALIGAVGALFGEWRPPSGCLRCRHK